MWIKLAIGAIVGLVLGHFLAPGYALWVILGIIGGYVTDVVLKKREQQQQDVDTGQ